MDSRDGDDRRTHNELTWWQKATRDAFIKSMLLGIASVAAWIASDMQAIKADFKVVNEIQIGRKHNVAYAGALSAGNPQALAVLCRNMLKNSGNCR